MSLYMLLKFKNSLTLMKTYCILVGLICYLKTNSNCEIFPLVLPQGLKLFIRPAA